MSIIATVQLVQNFILYYFNCLTFAISISLIVFLKTLMS